MGERKERVADVPTRIESAGDTGRGSAGGRDSGCDTALDFGDDEWVMFDAEGRADAGPARDGLPGVRDLIDEMGADRVDEVGGAGEERPQDVVWDGGGLVDVVTLVYPG
ncbi:hypothetical protein HYE82_19110 [Streptomyces sp. BR123]|uniref:hypothetical protein n=1 Tax=Streptomyces sp. BR123 TaxID=2749828 RepID=UPI0015C46FEF|nr:hypothetical protein [Streptomyces sp. BR123]NXY96462.1 hypothetical protein [Streptomyces sp. BR123]